MHFADLGWRSMIQETPKVYYRIKYRDASYPGWGEMQWDDGGEETCKAWKKNHVSKSLQ